MRKVATFLISMLSATTFAQGVIDVHSHIITPEFISSLEQENRLMDEGFPLPKYDVNAHLKWMDEAGVQTSILTLAAPQPSSASTIRQTNETAAKLKREHHGRYLFCAALPLPDVNAAIREAIYALDTLKADGIKLATNVQGQYLGAPELDTLFSVLNERKAVVILHPHRPDPVNRQVMQQTPLAMQEYLSETTRAVSNMISRNVLARYPQVKVVVPHCGAYLPLAVPRMKSLTPDNLLYGSDYPYVAPQVLTASLARMKQYLSNESDLAPFREMILHKNAEWLFGLSGEKPTAERQEGKMIVRLAEIEVYPEYLQEYLSYANEVDRLSVEREPGVICLFPMQSAEDSTRINILEIYASDAAYQQHLKTEHFQKYKQGTLHMVKSLKLPTMQPLDPKTMKLIFKKR